MSIQQHCSGKTGIAQFLKLHFPKHAASQLRSLVT